MTENWAYIGNRFYYSDNVSNTLPGQLLACVVENYEQGKLPSLPAPYSIKYCLDEWVGTYANDTSASSRNDQLDYVSFEKPSESLQLTLTYSLDIFFQHEINRILSGESCTVGKSNASVFRFNSRRKHSYTIRAGAIRKHVLI